MPELVVENKPQLDLLDLKTPALSATTDIPVVEIKPDSVPKEEPAAAQEAVPAAEEKAETPAPSETPDDAAAEPEPKKAKGVQKRIDELLAREREAIRRAEAADARLDRALAAIEKGTAKDTKPVDDLEPQKPVKDPENPEAYDAALEAYVTDRSSWIARREVKASLAEEERKRADGEIAEQMKKVQESYKARVEKVKEKYADYSDVAESPDVQVSIPMASAIAHSEEGPEIAYYLGKNPEEASRISKLVPQLQLVELGKIVAKLSTPPSKPISAAPKPGTPTKPSSETVPSPEEESMDAYAKRRKKELAEQNRPGVRH